MCGEFGQRLFDEQSNALPHFHRSTPNYSAMCGIIACDRNNGPPLQTKARLLVVFTPPASAGFSFANRQPPKSGVRRYDAYILRTIVEALRGLLQEDIKPVSPAILLRRVVSIVGVQNFLTM
jgi:hypothetical protein